MTNKLLPRLLWLCLTCSQTLLPAFCEDLYSTSSSIVGSKRNGVFLRLVSVEPNTFTWEGHNVAVSESWLEKFTKDSPENSLKFKFTVDGDKNKEALIGSGKKGPGREAKKLVLRIEGKTASGYHPEGFTGMRLRDYFIGGLTGEVIHRVRLDHAEPDQIKLRVITSTYDRKTMHTEYNPTDTILTFNLNDGKGTTVKSDSP